MVFDKYKVRSMNEDLVLKEVITSQPISRAMISKHTKLNKATVTEIISTLIERNLVKEIGFGESNTGGGRKPILLELNNMAGIALAFDLGNDYIDAIATDLNGDIIETFNQKNIQVTSENIVDLIQSAVSKFRPLVNHCPYGFIGLSAAVHGVVFEEHITLSPNYNMMGAHLYQKLTTLFDFPIHIENEANLAATAHIAYETDLKDLIVLSIHTGIGAGVIIDRSLYTGISGAAGEVGHMTIQPNGLDCRCGRKGCFEQYCSTKHILTQFAKLKQIDNPSINDVASAYTHDKEVQGLIDESCRYLAAGINNLVAVYDSEVIYIISDLAIIIPDILNKTQEYLKTEYQRDIKMYRSHPGFGATLRGAAILSISKFFGIDSLKLHSDIKKQLI